MKHGDRVLVNEPSHKDFGKLGTIRKTFHYEGVAIFEVTFDAGGRWQFFDDEVEKK